MLNIDPKYRVLQIISSAASSGAERHVLDLSIHLIKNGHSVQVVCPNGWLAEALKVQQIPCHVIEFKKQTYFKSVQMVHRLIKAHQIDIAHSHLVRASHIGFSASLIARIPLVSSVHVTKADLFYRISAFFKHQLISVSHYTAMQLEKKGISKKQIHVIHNGTDCDGCPKEDSSIIRKKWNIKKEDYLIGILGYVYPNKGQLIAIEALAKVLKEYPNTHLLCIGRFSLEYKSFLETRIKDLALENHVTFTDNQSNVVPLIDACDFMLMPSAVENLSIAALEIMARKKPIIASRTGALPEIIQHQKTGLLVERTPNAFASAICLLLSKPEQVMQLGQKAFEFVQQNCTNEVMVQKVEKVYEGSFKRSNSSLSKSEVRIPECTSTSC